MTGLDPERPTDPPFVPHTFPEHDDAVKELVDFGWRYAENRGLMMGVGVIDFADGTVVVLSHTIPPNEMVMIDRRSENHLIAGFGTHPFQREKVPDFTERLVEITNPDAPKKFRVNSTKETDAPAED